MERTRGRRTRRLWEVSRGRVGGRKRGREGGKKEDGGWWRELLIVVLLYGSFRCMSLFTFRFGISHFSHLFFFLSLTHIHTFSPIFPSITSTPASLPAARYYPAVSIFLTGRVRGNYGPSWICPPETSIPFSPMSDVKESLKRDELNLYNQGVNERRAALMARRKQQQQQQQQQQQEQQQAEMVQQQQLKEEEMEDAAEEKEEDEGGVGGGGRGVGQGREGLRRR